jgi:hypothetical protein
MHHRAHYWLGTGALIKRGGVKLVKKMNREMNDIYRKVSSIFDLIHEVNSFCH